MLVGDKELYPRKCDECGKGFIEGYCIDGGSEYFCNEECLHYNYSETQWHLMYSDDGDSYWTEWDDEDIRYEGIGYTITGEEVIVI